MNFTKVDGTSVMRLFRWIKVLRKGTKDILEEKQSSPWGIDSNPIKDMVAVYDMSGCNGEGIILGYVHKHNIAAVGETRLFCTNDNDEEQFYVWLKKDGTLELGGNSNHLVKYQELKTAFDQLRTDFNNLVSVFNTHVHAGVTTGGGSSGVTPTTGTASTADMSTAKINEIKTL